MFNIGQGETNSINESVFSFPRVRVIKPYRKEGHTTTHMIGHMKRVGNAQQKVLDKAGYIQYN